ncbi:MAG: aspartate dehydrogenase [Candidatus Omnitrophica bacterium]|nr:aspartate dehydrogenase [Candidatus Omnitrophota bacterium]
MKRIGIVGCGAIGGFLAKRIDKEFRKTARIAGLCDIDRKKAALLAGKLSKRPPVLELDKLIKASDLIIEAASGSISAKICKSSIEKGKDVMIMSTGGLLGKNRLFRLAREKKARIILPSGAICGLDGLKSASMCKVKKVTLTTRKPPKGLRGAPFILEKGIDLDSITGEKVIFEGTAREAVKGFPKNVNVSAILSLAGIGANKTGVRIITSPEYMVNMHEIEIEGDFGRLVTRTENMPFPENPKTSFLAALSAAATLKQILEENLRIGT